MDRRQCEFLGSNGEDGSSEAAVNDPKRRQQKRAKAAVTNVLWSVSLLVSLALFSLMQDSKIIAVQWVSFAEVKDAEVKDSMNSSTSTIDRISTVTQNDIQADNLEYCTQERGRDGSWYVNKTQALETFYVQGYRSGKWMIDQQKLERVRKITKRTRKDILVYPGNQYAWKDATEGQCRPIQPLNHQRFCRLMNTLAIDQLFFVGDSLTLAQLVSFLNLLGYKSSDFIPASRKETRKRDSLECDGNRTITIYKKRQNLGPNLVLTNLTGRKDRRKRVAFGPEDLYCTGKEKTAVEYCPWLEMYNMTDISKRSLLVVNQGAHFHSLDTFQASYDLFLEGVRKVGRPEDILVFRSTVPGHINCLGSKESPNIPPTNMTHDLFLKRYATTKYDWNLFDQYNQYAMEKLNQLSGSFSWRPQYLNVYNMTVLRPDQHVDAIDCLHYTHPGPIDYWNHLLFTNLADLAGIKDY